MAALKGLIAVVALMGGIQLLQAGLRLGFEYRDRRTPPRNVFEPYAAFAHRGERSETGEISNRVRLNALGFHDVDHAPPEKDDPRDRIILLGGRSLAAMEILLEQTVGRLLEATLRDSARPAEVLSFGDPRSEPLPPSFVLRRYGRPFSPILSVLMVGGEDVLRHSVAIPRWLDLGRPPLGFLSAHLRDPITMRNRLPEIWSFALNRLGLFLSDFVEESNSMGSRSVILTFDDFFQRDHRKETRPGGVPESPVEMDLRAVCRQRALPCKSITPTLEALAESGQPVTFRSDPHWTPQAHSAIAQVLANLWLAPSAHLAESENEVNDSPSGTAALPSASYARLLAHPRHLETLDRLHRDGDRTADLLMEGLLPERPANATLGTEGHRFLGYTWTAGTWRTPEAQRILNPPAGWATERISQIPPGLRIHVLCKSTVDEWTGGLQTEVDTRTFPIPLTRQLCSAGEVALIDIPIPRSAVARIQGNTSGRLHLVSLNSGSPSRSTWDLQLFPP